MSMRLTLRTLLAYLDNILEPGDAQEFAKKIEESKTAGELMQRIRDVTKKVRLGAPAVEGKGLGLDPNTVAEYLDNTMPTDRVADFELVCLESDVHLAEVAACHEILSLVLVNRAEIEPTARQRMYDLLHAPQPSLQAQPVGPAPQAVPVAAPIAQAAPAEPPRRFEVPEYLRQAVETPPKRSTAWVSIAAGIAALLVIGTIAALALVPQDDLPGFLRPVASVFFPPEPPRELKPEPPAGGPIPAPTPPSVRASAGTAPAGTASVGGVGPEGLRQPPTALAPALPTATATGAAPLPPLPVERPTPPSASATAMVAAPAGGATSPATPSGVPPIFPPAATPTAPTASPTAMAAVVAPSSPTATATPVVVQPPKIEPVGRIASAPTEVVLRFDPRAGWVRLLGQENLMVGDRVLSLPGFRPQLTLVGGVTVDLRGGTLVELLPIDPSGVAGVRLLRGRMLLLPGGAGGKAKLAVEDGKLRGLCTLNAGELGIERVFQRRPGADPALGAPWFFVFYAKSGEASWASAGVGELRLPPGSSWIVAEGGPPAAAPVGPLPGWLGADDRDPLERQAAEFIERNLAGDKATTVALKEAAGDRRIENVQLALRCLAQIGDYDDFGPLLRDQAQRYSTLERYLDWLSEALDYGPAYAEGVRAALVKQHGAEPGGALYRMLWGFDDGQLAAGAAKDLVEALDAAEFDFRVLAYWNLTRITGLPLSYVPQDTPLRRKQAIQKWQQKLEAGQIVWKKTP